MQSWKFLKIKQYIKKLLLNIIHIFDFQPERRLLNKWINKKDQYLIVQLMEIVAYPRSYQILYTLYCITWNFHSTWLSFIIISSQLQFSRRHLYPSWKIFLSSDTLASEVTKKNTKNPVEFRLSEIDAITRWYVQYCVERKNDILWWKIKKYIKNEKIKNYIDIYKQRLKLIKKYRCRDGNSSTYLFFFHHFAKFSEYTFTSYFSAWYIFKPRKN